MRILGIDPGLQITGYGLIDAGPDGRVSLVEAGVIRTSSGEPIENRVNRIYSNLESIIDSLKPEVLVLEKLYSHQKHPVTSILMAHARGVVCLACGRKNIKLVNYPATRIKKAITGTGSAKKEQVQRVIMTALKLRSVPEPIDITDALSLALGYVHIEFKNRKFSFQLPQDFSAGTKKCVVFRRRERSSRVSPEFA